MTPPSPVNLKDELAEVKEFFSPRVVAELNGQYLKVARLQGEFVWHQHANEDELFLILRGSLRIDFEDGSVTLNEGDCLVVPRGVRHRPVAESECAIALFEPVATAHTGDVSSELTRSVAEQTAHLR